MNARETILSGQPTADQLVTKNLSLQINLQLDTSLITNDFKLNGAFVCTDRLLEFHNIPRLEPIDLLN